MTIGKYRRLQQAATTASTFAILAIDHRGPLRRALATEAGKTLPHTTLAALKKDIVRELAPAASAVLLDPETGVGPCIADGALPGATGLIVALDTGSTGDPHVVKTQLVENWSVAQTAALGASGVKLLLYYHPDAPEAAEREQLVRSVADDCRRYDIPLFLEPLSHSPDPSRRPLPSVERRAVVVETARRLVPLGVDVLKAEFPVNVEEQPDEAVWRQACDQLTAACPVPWVLLSAGVSFDTFLRQVQVACRAGASGVMAGRAVWAEAVTLDLDGRRRFLSQVARDRMRKLREICDATARPFTDVYSRESLPPGSLI